MVLSLARDDGLLTLNSIESIEDSTPPIETLETLPRKLISPNSFIEYGDPVLFWEKARIEKVQKKLSEKLAEIDIKNIDDSRFEQELIYYLEKQDITEEKVRLDAHLNYFIETISAGSPIGKKLGFIGQEIGREINTIGSKSSDVNMQQIVVQMKDELEKIKEQLLNILW